MTTKPQGTEGQLAGAKLVQRFQCCIPRSLRWQLRVEFALMLLGVLLISGSVVVFFVYRTEQMSWRNRQLEAASNAAHRISAFLRQQEQALTLVGSFGRDELHSKPEKLHAWMEQNPALIEVVFLDRTGRVVDHLSKEQPGLANQFTIQQSQWFREAHAGRRYFGDAQISTQGQPYLIMALPSSDNGVVAARLDMNVLRKIVAELRFGHSGQAYVVNLRGLVIAHSDPAVVLARTDIAGRPGLGDLLLVSDNAWHPVMTGLQGSAVICATAFIRETDWLVFTELTAWEAYAASRTALLLLLCGVIVFGLLAIKINACFLDRLVLQPLQQLQIGAMQIEQGNLEYRIATISQDEVGQLAKAFNQMAASLKERDDQLETKSLGLAQEIAERRWVEEALRESQARFELAVQGANDGLWDWDLRNDTIYFSQRWKSMLGCPEDEIGDSPDEWFKRIHLEDLQQVKLDLSAHLKGFTPHFENEHRMLHKDGGYCWVLTRGLAVSDADGITYRMAGSQSDITLRKRAEEQLLHDAFHDALTGLPNRALFTDRLERAIERAKRHGDYQFAVLFMDLDRFKVINDSLGHNLGDELLVAIACRLSIYLRSSDTAARLGGDEFVLLLEDIKDIAAAQQAAERIQEELRLPFNLDGHEVFVATSIGIVLSGSTGDQPADILRDADLALYRAKALGKGRCEVFDTVLRAQAINRLEVESELRNALERHEFQLYYQPIYALRTGMINGFEALLRWDSPARGLVLPGEFIPVAEETGLIIPLGDWALREACRQMRAWQVEFPVFPALSIHVNISGKQFAHPKLVERIEQILEETGLPPACLKLEITESVFMDYAASANTVLVRLHKLGVNLEIDDFGTGYSSLSYLQRFPINTIKVDRSFVSRIGVNGNNAEIIKTIVALARDLGMDAIAEGIETAEQLEQLKALDCPYGQGFFFARPMSSEMAWREILRQARSGVDCLSAGNTPMDRIDGRRSSNGKTQE